MDGRFEVLCFFIIMYSALICVLLLGQLLMLRLVFFNIAKLCLPRHQMRFLVKLIPRPHLPFRPQKLLLPIATMSKRIELRSVMTALQSIITLLIGLPVCL